MSLSADIRAARDGVDAERDELLMRWAAHAQMLEGCLDEATTPRPIATAPHGPMGVLLYDAKEDWWFTDQVDAHDAHTDDPDLTHWLPLPRRPVVNEP